jgi:transposase InsO family protein
VNAVLTAERWLYGQRSRVEGGTIHGWCRGREFCGTERHPYELYLARNDIEHRKTRVGSPRTNGFVERFNGTVLTEFFQPKMRETFYDSVDALQADLDAWLHHYNCERPHLGDRNQGRRPWETVELFVSQEG